MKNGNLLIALVIGGVIGFVVGKATSTPGTNADATANAGSDGAGKVADNTKPAPRKTGGDDPNALYKVPVTDQDNIRGNKDAKVTVVEFSDFECPFCQRAAATVDQIRKTYGDDVRIVYKNNPLPMHPHSEIAAEASLAAGAQGKYWEMHDKLFANRDHLERADLEKYAGEIGLNLATFKADLDSGKFKKRILEDQAMAQNFQAGGTPHFFIDGKRVVGAQPFESFKAVIDEDLKKVDQLIASGTPKKQPAIYDALTRNALSKATPAQPSPQQQGGGAKAVLLSEEEFKAGASRGPKDAKVTIVEWSDFQCPYCGRATPTVDKLVETYPKDVRLVFLHEPLPMHPNAVPAAVAAVAAQNQGKFWEFYDKAFKNQTQLSPDNYEKWAKEIGLDVSKFKSDLENPETKKRVMADATLGQKKGANGTPTFFIDGRMIAGALPLESFKSMIDEEIKKADDLIKKGVPRDQLYAKLNELNVKTAPPPEAPAPGDDGKPVAIDIGDSPVRGPAKAPVTIVEFSDFQCPFCGRVEPTIAELLKKYDGKIKIVWKNQPLPFHPNARPAAKAALAVYKQNKDKFWEMHDKMFANRDHLEQADLDNYAREIGLDLKKFHADATSQAATDFLAADRKQADALGVQGTPTIYINGREFEIRQDLDEWIAQELAPSGTAAAH
jgi:protein-disulfide isomerase